VREIAKFHDVAGRTAEDPRSAMNRLGPVGKDGMRFDGYSVWYLRWKVQVRGHGHL
jgi:predicted secreted Zn-dependent protease